MSLLQSVLEVIVGAVVLVMAMGVHGLGMYFVLVRAERLGAHRPGHDGFRIRQWFFGELVLTMMATHIAEMVLWSAVMWAIGAIPNLRDAFYMSSVTYTTLGYEDIKLSTEWRLLAPICAMNGVFAFGWTTSVLMIVLARHFMPARRGEGSPPGMDR